VAAGDGDGPLAGPLPGLSADMVHLAAVAFRLAPDAPEVEHKAAPASRQAALSRVSRRQGADRSGDSSNSEGGAAAMPRLRKPAAVPLKRTVSPAAPSALPPAAPGILPATALHERQNEPTDGAAMAHESEAEPSLAVARRRQPRPPPFPPPTRTMSFR
jgi:hypothetical protein